MRYQNILVPYDLSEPAQRALEATLDIVGDESDVCVHVVRFVVDEENSGGLFSFFQKNEAEDERAAMLKEAKAELEASVKGLLSHEACRSRVVCVPCLDAPDGIVEYVEGSAIDMVVMGSRGLGSVRGLFGSVSNWVLHNVNVPVMIVK